MKILYAGLLYNYGKPEEGFSYEHHNLEAGLKDCAKRGMFEVDYFYPDACTPKPVACGLNTRFEHPGLSVDDVLNSISSYDAIFHVAFNESLDLPENVARLALKQDVLVIQFDCDSSWRFNNWILPRKDRVSHFVTTHSATIPWYEQNGMKVIRSQWGGSPEYLAREKRDKQFDVTFIGQKHGIMPDGRFLRAEIVDAIMAAGIKIDLFGNYWDGYSNWHGYTTDFADVIRIFQESRICLNLSNPWHHGTMPQIKGRHFEIPQTGRLQICTPADDLASYFVEGKEIVVVNSLSEMIDKIKYYLVHEDEREQIAEAGLQRMLKDHQWHHRFSDIFMDIFHEA